MHGTACMHAPENTYQQKQTHPPGKDTKPCRDKTNRHAQHTRRMLSNKGFALRTTATNRQYSQQQRHQQPTANTRQLPTRGGRNTPSTIPQPAPYTHSNGGWVGGVNTKERCSHKQVFVTCDSKTEPCALGRPSIHPSISSKETTA